MLIYHVCFTVLKIYFISIGVATSCSLSLDKCGVISDPNQTGPDTGIFSGGGVTKTIVADPCVVDPDLSLGEEKNRIRTIEFTLSFFLSI